MSSFPVSRKRDRIRMLFGGSRPPSLAFPTPALPNVSSSNATSSQTTLYLDPAAKLFAEVLSLLGTKERETVEKYVVHGVTDINTAVVQAYAAALDQKQACDDKSWRWTFRGRTVVLRDEADKVLRWLDRFKSVGDVIANVDPIHIGLPWAGIRMLLEVAGVESRQMAALLVGMNLAMSTASRLQVYFDYLGRLPSTLAKDNFAKALLKMYVHVLRFIATAIQTYEASLSTRVTRAFWQTSSLEDFEVECDKLGQRAETEASNCDREMNEQDREVTQRWRDEMKNMLKSIDQVQGISDLLSRVHIKVDLTKLITAPGATYSSHAEEELAHCLPGTRVQLLDQIAQWADDLDGKAIFWLCGKAGTGKSTISRTVAHRLDEQRRLGASFFFKRGEGDRGNASRFFATIAAQLADVVPRLAPLIAEALERDSFLSSRGLQGQFEKLLSQPLADLRQAQAAPSRVFVVIDALDECESDSSIQVILSLLARLEAIASLRLYIFVTSRPELPIKLGFSNMSGSVHHDMVLEEVQVTTIEHDIRLYFQYRLEEIRFKDCLQQPDEPLPTDWPREENINVLVNLAVPLFIFAFTVCRYIAESDPPGRLEAMLQQGHNTSLSGLERTYLPILNRLTVGSTPGQSDQIITDFRELVGSIILLASPLSVPSLSRLLEVPVRTIRERLSKLHSVLHIPADRDEPIRLFHLSFRDFLVDVENKDNNPFWVEEHETHSKLARKCLLLLSQPNVLRKDLCNIQTPGRRRHEISHQVISSSIAPDTAYACSYWVWHFLQSGKLISDGCDEHVFLQTHFLHWMEALSWLGRLSGMIAHISTLRSRVQPHHGTQLIALLDDARRFVLRNRQVVDLAPLQLYSSALVFTPTRSIIRQIYERDHSLSWLTLRPKVPPKWSAEMQKLEGHDGYVTAVAFSPDGRVVASASYDKTVRLWNAVTGEAMQKLEGHDEYVTAVAFSPDGQVLASASRDNTVRLWNAVTGEAMQKLEGHDSYVTAAAFSPDGQVLASASYDQTVRLWNAVTGEAMQKLEGHDNYVTAVAFSPDRRVLASASFDQTVRLWNAVTGEAMQKLEGHNHFVSAVAFSPNGHVLASASYDRTVRLWNALTGEAMQKLEDHTNFVSAVAFSPDGQVLASASGDKTVRLWNAVTGEAMQKLEGHDNHVSAVAFSPDGQVLASASYDRTVRLWNVVIGEAMQKLEGHDHSIIAVAFSPDGHVLASASGDHTVRLWNTVTGEAMRKLEGHDLLVSAVAFSPSGHVLASASYDQTVRLWNAVTGEAMQKLEGHDHFLSALAFSPSGHVLASASDDRTVRLWNAVMGEAMQKLEGHSNYVTAVAFSPNGQVLASASGDKTVRLWNAVTGEAMQKLEGHNSPVTTVTFSPDGQVLASTSEDKTVRLWNALTGEAMQNLEGHDNRITTVAFSPDGRMLATASFDQTVRLWNAVTGGAMQKLGTSNIVKKISFAIDGKSLITDVGRFDIIIPMSAASIIDSIHAVGLGLHGEWVQYQGQDLLWLPHEYRGICSMVRSNTLVIGQYSGALSFFRYGPV